MMARAFDFGGKLSGRLDLSATTDFKSFQQFKRGTFIEAFGPTHMPDVYRSIENIFKQCFEKAAAQDSADITDVLHESTMQARVRVQQNC